MNLQYIGRRGFLADAGAFSLCAGCLTARDRPVVTFGMTADVHYADIDDRIGRHYRDAADRLAECVVKMNELRPDFLIELGDFKDLGPTPDATLEGLRRIERVFAGFRGPRYHVLGNHDCDALTPQEFMAEVRDGGRIPVRTFYRFDVNGVTFIVLDGCYTSDMRHYSRSNPWTDANVPPEELDWLERELDSACGHTVIFCHQRMDPDAEVHHLLRNAEQVRGILERSGKVRAVFTGHQHDGGGCLLNDIRYLTLPSVVDDDECGRNSFAVASVYGDGRVSVRGWHRVSEALVRRSGCELGGV